MTTVKASKVPGSAAKKPPGGSRKGKPNKTTAALKDMILQALDGVGGVAYLERKAKDPRTASAFLTLVGKVLPMTVQGAGPDGAHVFKVIERRIVKPGT
jgi:hypothetical protein